MSTRAERLAAVVRTHPIACLLLFLVLLGVVYMLCTNIPATLEMVRCVKARELLKSIGTALEAYHDDHGMFPSVLAPDLTTPIPYFQGTFSDPYVPDKLLEYYAPKEGGWILISRGPDGVVEIDPRLDFDPKRDGPTDAMLRKTYQPGGYYNMRYNNNDPNREGKGDIWWIRLADKEK